MLKNIIATLSLSFLLLTTIDTAIAANNPSSVLYVDNITDLQDLGQASLQYKYTIVGGIQGSGDTFSWIAGNLPCDTDSGGGNGGTTFCSKTSDGKYITTGYWERQYSGPVHAVWFGADPSGNTDSTAAFGAMIAYIAPGKKAIVDCGDYHISSALVLTGFHGTIDGQTSGVWSQFPAKSCARIWQDANNAPIFYFDDTTNGSYSWTIENLGLLWTTQQTASDVLSNAFYFDGDGVNYARGQILNNGADRGYGFLVENSTVSPTIWDSLISGNNHGLNMVGPFIDMREAVTTGQSGNVFSNNDIRGSSTASGVVLVNLQGCTSCSWNGNVFGQNTQPNVMNLLSCQLTGDNLKIVESATLASVGNILNVVLSTVTFNTMLIDGTLTAISGKLYAINAYASTVNIGQLSFGMTSAGASMYLVQADPSNSFVNIGQFGSFLGDDTGFTSWTDITSTFSSNALNVEGAGLAVLSPNQGDTDVTWVPPGGATGASQTPINSNILLFSSPLTANRTVTVANTDNLSGNTCLRVLKAPGTGSTYTLSLAEPDGTVVASFAAGEYGEKSICYHNVGHTRNSSWYAQ